MFTWICLTLYLTPFLKKFFAETCLNAVAKGLENLHA